MKLLHIHFYVSTLNTSWQESGDAAEPTRSPVSQISLQQLLLLGNNISGGAIKRKKHTLVFWVESGHLVLAQSGNSRRHGWSSTPVTPPPPASALRVVSILLAHGGGGSGFSCQLKARRVTQKANYKTNAHTSPYHSVTPQTLTRDQGSRSQLCSHDILLFS